MIVIKALLKRFILVLILFLFFNSDILSQKLKRIIIEDYAGATFLPKKIKNESIKVDLYDGRFLKIHLYDYKGKMSLKCFSVDSVLVEEGNYINSIDLLKKYTYSYSGSDNKTVISTVEYYQPLRNGVWKFYDKKGVLIDSVFYKQGVKLE